ALAASRFDSVVNVSELGVAIQLYLPEVMAASYGSPPAMRPPPPIAAPGGGWLSADLGASGDRERFTDLLSTLPADVDAGMVESAAQEWRLAVWEYRSHQPDDPEPPVRVTPSSPARPRAAGRGVMRVCDLTAMWAGPLATWLLQGLGATV